MISKHTFTVGQFVKCVTAKGTGYRLTEGLHYRVKQVHTGGTGAYLITVDDDLGFQTQAFAARFEPKVTVPLPFKAGDRVVFKKTESYYCTGLGLTIGRPYKVTRTRDDTDGKQQLIWVINDRGNEVSSYAERIETTVPHSVAEEREKRKAAEVARKEAGRARVAAMAAPYGKVKKPLLFTELSNSQVHTAVENAISSKLPGLRGVRVLGIDKTTEGYKVTLGQYE